MYLKYQKYNGAIHVYILYTFNGVKVELLNILSNS